MNTSDTEINDKNINTNKNLGDILKPGDIVGTYSNSTDYQHVMVYVGDDKYANMADSKWDVYTFTYPASTVKAKYVFRMKGSGSSSENENSSESDSSNSTSKGKGKVISTSDVNSTGYTGIYESSITGRKFKEYKQNVNSFVNKYDISSVNCKWGSECGTVASIIIGSGYNNKANFSDVSKN